MTSPAATVPARRRARRLSGPWLQPGFVIGAVWIGLVVLLTLIQPILPIPDAFKQNLPNALQSPSLEHLLGTDQIGRDTLARLIYGARFSLALGLTSVILALGVGLTIGVISGYLGGRTDLVVQRVVDILLAFPSFLLALLMIAALGVNPFNLSISVAIGAAPSFIRLARAKALELRSSEFVEAAQVLGVSKIRIMVTHVVPHVLPVCVINATVGIGAAIIEISGLGFLGLGVQPPNPEWGTMLAEARMVIFQYPLQTLFPGLVIAMTVLSFNLMGDTLRDALDPKMARKA